MVAFRRRWPCQDAPPVLSKQTLSHNNSGTCLPISYAYRLGTIIIMMWTTKGTKNLMASALGGMREILQHSGISGSNLTSSSLIWPPKDGKSCQMSTKIQTFDIEIPPIKCLHAHYAQYLSCTSTRVSWCARDVTVVSKDLLESYSFLHHSPITNPVGEMIHDQLQKEYPSLWY
jgi:hypothetical protein